MNFEKLRIKVRKRNLNFIILTISSNVQQSFKTYLLILTVNE